MLKLDLVSLTIESFKSFRQRTTIDFPQASGLHFLTGRNEAEPRLGANGAGKSSLWDALFWACYGVSVLGDKASALASYGAKRPYVNVVFAYGDSPEDVLIIERWGSPDRLMVDGEIASQDKVCSLLKMSKARFAQSVVFGQRASMFYDLDIPARGALLNEVLDLSIWERASEQATLAVSTHSATLREHERELDRAEGAYAALPSLDELEAKAKNWENDFYAELETRIKRLEEAETDLAACEGEYNSLRSDYVKPDRTALRDLQTKRDTLRHAASVELGTAQALAKTIGNFKHLKGKCPTCYQEISAQFTVSKLHDLDCEHVALLSGVDQQRDKLSALEKDIKNEEKRLEAAEDKQRDVVRRGGETAARLKALKGAIDLLESDINRSMRNKSNPYYVQIKDVTEQEQELFRSAKALQDQVDDLTSTITLTEYWKQGFKRIRLNIIQDVLLHLEIDTHNAANVLGIGDWQIKYATESENKSGTIKHGVQIIVSSPAADVPCSLPSGGEGQRIRLAIEMGLATLIQRLSGVSYGFEVWDEPSAFLSDEGLDDLVTSLRERVRETGKSVWLTDHRTYGFAFDTTWTIVKSVDRGSYIEHRTGDVQ